jgi:hypothetical protein
MVKNNKKQVMRHNFLFFSICYKIKNEIFRLKFVCLGKKARLYFVDEIDQIDFNESIENY